MPIFEYQCNSCRHCFEKLVMSSRDDEKVSCPECGHTDVSKLISCVSAFDGAKSGFCKPAGNSPFS
jgi:putative FmdB family regulatory protein